uniref:G_PROTEIN_RECEP_F1_2 domain-containing protein n=1 Tax=Steinernema glaseri TaxID=37863 RepID=A0A1I8ACZ4_9BILA
MTSLWLIGNSAFKLLESLVWMLAIMASTYSVRCFIRASLLHFNLKLILINFSIGLVLYGASRLGMNVDSVLQSFGVGPANLACRNALIAPKVLTAITMLMGFSCVLLITVERTVATFVPRKYEQMNKAEPGVVVFIAVWITSIFVAMAITFTSNGESPQCDRAVPSDSAFIIHSHTELLLAIFILGTSGSAINGALLYFLHTHNKKRRNKIAPGQLNVRYQYTENIMTTRFLVALTIVVFVVGFTGTIIILSYLIVRNTDLLPDEDLIFIEQCFHCVAAFYGVLHNVVCLGMHRPNRDQLLRDFSWCFRRTTKVEKSGNPQVKSVEGQYLSFKNETTVYFSYLSQQWNSTPSLA